MCAEKSEEGPSSNCEKGQQNIPLMIMTFLPDVPPPLTQTEYRWSLKCVRGARSLEIGAIYFNLKMYLALKVAFEDCLARKKYFRPLLMIIGAITSLIYMHHPHR